MLFFACCDSSSRHIVSCHTILDASIVTKNCNIRALLFSLLAAFQITAAAVRKRRPPYNLSRFWCRQESDRCQTGAAAAVFEARLEALLGNIDPVRMQEGKGRRCLKKIQNECKDGEGLRARTEEDECQERKGNGRVTGGKQTKKGKS
jgi:hypothetical protein